ncbi:MAG: hybrid sensor histidine kinase/response regulator [Telluria sp.]|nr:hybrid sensor histidine kinase/response regulator [Telluria sp.]
MMHAQRNPVTVLYVDDEAMARKYFSLAVAPDYSVLTAADVSGALKILADPGNHVDVIVTDYRMPGCSGGELLRQVEQHYPHIVRLLVTAYADKDVLLDTINGSEIFRVMEKPLELEALRNTLHLASARARECAARRESLLAIEETLAFLAHELNTPLATIVNFARGIERRVGCPTPGISRNELGDAAGAMHDNAKYCLSVLSSFVDSVKLAKAAPLRGDARASRSAHQLITTLLDTYPLTPAQRGMIELDVQHDFPITALPNCVALVLSSILSNALRALAGHAAPALRFTIKVARNPQIHLRDNGPGIPAEVLERLLVDPVTGHADAGGNGWGMIFCNRIMQSFGGNILVQSEQGRSTTIALNFPASKKE